MSAFWWSIFSATFDAAPALVFAALGGVLSERSGIVSVHLDGMMRAGAFAAAVAALSVPPSVAIFAGALAGLSVAAIHGLLTIRFGAEQVVSGMALNLLTAASSSFLLEALFSSPSGTPEVEALTRFGGFHALSWLTIPAIVLVHVAVQYTRFGLRLRASGEKPQAVTAMGVSVSRLRTAAVLVGGAFAGIGGAALSLGTLNHFEHHMPSGLGFMALAAVVFGRWRPINAGGAALFFSFGNALRLSLTSSFPAVTQWIPGGLLLAVPYLLTLLLLSLRRQGGEAPAALGQPYAVEQR